MFRILDGRANFWQWDLNQKLIIADSSIDEVHFCNRTSDCALVCKTYTEGELTLVDVPNELLQVALDIRAYAYLSNHTVTEKIFKVGGRNKPTDYIYTPTEVFQYETILAEVQDINANIAATTEAYLEEHKDEFKGDDYVLTQQDKQDIADIVAEEIINPLETMIDDSGVL